MLREASIKPELLLAEIAATGLGTVRNRLTGPLAEFVLALAGIDPTDTKPSKPAPGKRVEPEQVFAQLFGIATGALGWTPEGAWNATPAEIIAAHNGQTAHLIRTGILVQGEAEKTASQAAHYTPEKLAEIEALGTDSEFDRAGLAKLKAML
ncbi:MAG: phage tail assembly chaperone [Devosia sp.]